jgi:hypothetical protein
MMHSVSLPLAAHPHNSYEKIFHLSTEPTTPEKRATTSPILRALEIGDEPSILQSVERAINGRNLSTNTTLLSQASRTTKVCYIGAGYVGMLQYWNRFSRGLYPPAIYSIRIPTFKYSRWIPYYCSAARPLTTQSPTSAFILS